MNSKTAHFITKLLQSSKLYNSSCCSLVIIKNIYLSDSSIAYYSHMSKSTLNKDFLKKLHNNNNDDICEGWFLHSFLALVGPLEGTMFFDKCPGSKCGGQRFVKKYYFRSNCGVEYDCVYCLTCARQTGWIVDNL